MEYSTEQLRYWLAMMRVPGIGPAKLCDILSSNSPSPSKSQPGPIEWEGADKDLAWQDSSADCHIITHFDVEYSSLLKEIPGTPPILFVRGDLNILSRIQIAMVGSRNPTPTGCECARQFAQHFSSQGITVTSGLALGIDGAAHQGALLGSGSTIAVLGNGLDQIYPASHRALAHEIIAKGGALVSEFPIGTPSAPSHFPRRNRIISGLSVGTLVVEAALNSGSLVTAKYALEQGREVFAIPGSIHSPVAKGCHALIKQGAKLVEDAEDVIGELAALMHYVANSDTTAGTRLGEEPQSRIRQKTKLSIQPAQTRDHLEKHLVELLAEIGYEATSVDTLVARSGLTAKAVSSMLIELELKGHIVAVPGGYLLKTSERV